MSTQTGELAIAVISNEGRRVDPPAIPAGMKVLDVGCGAGPTLIAHCGDRYSFGIDIDWNVLAAGKALTEKIGFTCGRAETLPFRDCTFDFVIARVSLPYTNIPKSLSEIRRVLKPQAQLWAVLERPSLPFHLGLYRRPRFYVLLPYIFFNTALFHLFSISVPFVDGKYRGYQTVAGLKRALRKTGFEEIKVVRSIHLITMARRSDTG
ncbi:MAG: SAM-dependent methlyltransferase [Bryobacterales bacterium]|nr:SAM-dependent methlyltransferase [Bryobacterales bacterium]